MEKTQKYEMETGYMEAERGGYRVGKPDKSILKQYEKSRTIVLATIQAPMYTVHALETHFTGGIGCHHACIHMYM